MQSHSTQNEMTSQLYDTLDISCQPGTATGDTNAAASRAAWPPSTVRPTHLHCLHLWTPSHKQTNERTNMQFIPRSCYFQAGSCEQHFNKGPVYFFSDGHFYFEHTACKHRTGLWHYTECCSYLWELASIQNNICPFSLAWLKHPDSQFTHSYAQ